MNLLIVLIGTGGHLIPLLPLMRGLRTEGFKVLTVTRLVGVERHLAKNPDLIVNVLSFSGRPLIIKLRSILTILIATIRIGRFMKSNGVKGVIVSGAFGSVPAILAAIYLRIPYFLIELNRIPGRVVRIFSRRAETVFVAIPLIRRVKGKIVITGLPLREGFIDLEREGRFIMIMGGSQGARFLNRLSIDLARVIDEKILLIAGERDYEWMKEHADRIEVISFTNEPWRYVERAEVVIARAGGLSTYELASCRVPMILIPFPYATDQHQQANARYYADNNAAIVIKEDEPNRVVARIVEVIRSQEYKKLGMKNPPVDGKDKIIEEVKQACLAR